MISIQNLLFNEYPVINNSEIDYSNKKILSLFDLSGSWSAPYKQNGYEVTQIDIQAGIDIMTWDYRKFERNHFSGILAAVPCTDFAVCGATHFFEKDNNGSTYESMALVYKTLAIVQWFRPGLRFWVIENPASRIHNLCRDMGKIKCKFEPYQFSGYLNDPVPEQYAKKTWLWGDFKIPIPKPLPCLLKGEDRHSKVGGKSEKTKNFRSKTPSGFSIAFYNSNK